MFSDFSLIVMKLATTTCQKTSFDKSTWIYNQRILKSTCSVALWVYFQSNPSIYFKLCYGCYLPIYTLYGVWPFFYERIKAMQFPCCSVIFEIEKMIFQNLTLSRSIRRTNSLLIGYMRWEGPSPNINDSVVLKQALFWSKNRENGQKRDFFGDP